MSSRLTSVGAASAAIVMAAMAAGCSSGGTKADPVAAAVTGPEPAVVASYQVAMAALEQGNDAQAEATLQTLANAYRDYSGPLVNLALIHARRNEIEPAITLLQRAVTVCAHCAGPWNQLGLMQRQQGRFTEAEQSYLKSIAADPTYANAYFNLGVLYELYLQRPELALDNYGRFRSLAGADPLAGDVDKWIADLKRRAQAVERSAQVEEAK